MTTNPCPLRDKHVNPGAVSIAVIDGKKITEAADLSAAKAGEPVRLKAIEGGQYLLAQGEKGLAPQKISIKRVGKDLHLSLEGSDEPQLIIEGFYEHGGQLVGVADDGAYYEYVSSDAEKEHEAAFLMDNDTSVLKLGSDKLVGFGDGLVVVASNASFLPALLALGAGLGVAGAVLALGKSGGGGGGGGVAPPPPPGTGDGDDNGNPGNPGGPGVPPQKPAVPQAGDDVGAITGLITQGASTNDATPTFSGGGQPGNKVEIIDNGIKIGEAVVKDDGTWTFTPDQPLPEGAHRIVVVEVGAGGSSEPSDGFDFIVDTQAPEVGEPDQRGGIGDVYDDVGNPEGGRERVANGGLTNDDSPEITGSERTFGEVVHIRRNGVDVGSAIVQVDGTWAFVDSGLVDGSHDYTLIVKDAACNESVESSEPYTLRVDTTAPGTPVISRVEDDSNADESTGNVAENSWTDDTTPTFHGKADPDSIVYFFDGANPIGSAQVDEAGDWTFTPTFGLGWHSVTVQSSDEAGNSSTSDVFRINVVNPPFSAAENFDTTANTLLKNGSSHEFESGLKFTILSVAYDWWYDALILDSADQLQQNGGSHTRYEFSRPGEHVDFTAIAHSDTKVSFYAADGVLLHTLWVRADASSEQYLSYTSDDQLIAYVDVESVLVGERGAGFWVSSVNWGSDTTRSAESKNEAYVLNDFDDYSALALAAEGDAWDFSQLSASDQHRSIDVVDLTGHGNNTLKLSVNDILSRGEVDLFQNSDRVQLKVEGDQGDIVELQGLVGDDPGEWIAQGQITSGGKVYEVYQHAGQNTELLVEQGVQTHLI
ncbi:Ig-like domain-containing protein [Pseudomonas fluorescens]|uniref:Ig-like domain-containing protein n=1 Tax=Pseudomonas fluorescens TaxID=294 RepID=UPI001A9ECB21|nr:Ig-like domain-containing protein [Pseudomonas fluorescens]QTD31477.1 hypothetical protein JZM58_19510 [Pseudomonas fluorescens]